jgi:hypothetical protein
LVNGFIDHLYTPLGTVSNYSAVANLHTLQITTAPAKLFSSLQIFISCYLATASVTGDSSTSHAQVLSSQPPVQNCLKRKLTTNWVRVRVTLRLAITASQFVLATSPLRLTISNFIFQLNTCGYSHYVRSSLTRGWFRRYNCCWSSPAQSFSDPSPAELKTLFYCLRFGTSLFVASWRPGPRIYIPQEQVGPVIPPGTGFLFRRLLRLAGLRWRYSTSSLGPSRKHRFHE